LNRITAPHYLYAARSCAVLAAWVSIIYENEMPAECDVSPYDHLEAYQDLFRYGAIDGREYDKTDLKHCFFSGTRPAPGEVQFALDYLRTMDVETHLTESNVPRKELQVFERQSITGPGNGHGQLREAPRLDELSVFDDRAQAPAIGNHRSECDLAVFEERPQPRAIAQVHERSYLENARSHAYQGRSSDTDLRFTLSCFGDEENPHQGMEVAFQIDETAEITAAESGEPMSLREYVFHGTCSSCGTDYHFSAAKPIPPWMTP
jgi:hypothetical protein